MAHSGNRNRPLTTRLDGGLDIDQDFHGGHSGLGGKGLHHTVAKLRGDSRVIGRDHQLDGDLLGDPDLADNPEGDDVA